MSVPKRTDLEAESEEPYRWRTALASGGSGQCVEVALAPGAKRVGIRDSKAPEEGEIWMSRVSFDALQDAVSPHRKK